MKKLPASLMETQEQPAISARRGSLAQLFSLRHSKNLKKAETKMVQITRPYKAMEAGRLIRKKGLLARKTIVQCPV